MHSAANYTILDVALHNNRSCGLPPDNSFHIFRSADDPNFPWPGMVFGLTVMALNAWCFDQVRARWALNVTERLLEGAAHNADNIRTTQYSKYNTITIRWK